MYQIFQEKLDYFECVITKECFPKYLHEFIGDKHLSIAYSVGIEFLTIAKTILPTEEYLEWEKYINIEFNKGKLK